MCNIYFNLQLRISFTFTRHKFPSAENHQVRRYAVCLDLATSVGLS